MPGRGNRRSDNDDLYLYMLAAGYSHETSSNGSTGLEDRTGGEQLDFDRGEGLDELGIW